MARSSPGSKALEMTGWAAQQLIQLLRIWEGGHWSGKRVEERKSQTKGSGG